MFDKASLSSVTPRIKKKTKKAGTFTKLKTLAYPEIKKLGYHFMRNL